MASKSLGVLTLDLVAKVGGFVNGMSQAERNSKKWRREVEKDLKAVGDRFSKFSAAAVKSLVATGAAAATSLAVVINRSRQTIDEQAKLARALGGTTAGMDTLARAGGRAGVSTSDLQSATTRLNQQLGVAIQRGGPAADTLERLGLSAEKLSRMDVDERFAAISARMGEMKLSTQLVAAELRSLGIRQSSVITLMQDGAAAIEESRRKLSAYGVLLSDIDASKVEQMNDAFEDLSVISTGLGKQLTVQVAPIIEAVALKIAGVVEQSGGMAAVVEMAFDRSFEAAARLVGAMEGLKSIVSGIWDGYRNLPTWAQEVGLIGAIIGGRKGLVVVAAAAKVASDTQVTAQWFAAWQNSNISFFEWFSTGGAEARARLIELNMLQDQIGGGPSIFGSLFGSGGERQEGDWQARFRKFIADAQEASRLAAEASVAGRNGRDTVFSVDENDQDRRAREAVAKSIANQIEQLQFQSMYVHKSADELTILKLAAEGATDAQLALAESALANIAAFKAQEEAEKAMIKEMEKLNADALNIAESLKGEEQLIRESYERRRQIILDNTVITGEARKNLLLELEKKTNAELEELNRGYWGNYLAALEENFENMDAIAGDMLNNLSAGFGNAFESMIFDAESLENSIYKLADGMLRSVVNALGQMAGQWIAYQAVQLATGNATQAAVAATSAASGTAIASAYAPAAAMASLASFGANSAPAMAGITATNALAKGMALAGMAHDGMDSIPKTGTWLLEKGERVTTADTSAKLDRTLNDVQGTMQSGGGEQNIRIVNAWDASMIGDYMGSSSGERVIMNAVRKNSRTIRSLATA